MIITDEDPWIGVETSDIDSIISPIVIGWSCYERIVKFEVVLGFQIVLHPKYYVIFL